MDNTADTMRPVYGFVSGDHIGSVKSKKERLKWLSLVGRTNGGPDEMRTVVCSNNDDGPNGNTKRLKLSKKSLNGCKVAGKAAVPRKLRTAMKKRSCKSPSPTLTDLKKPDTHTSTLEDRPPKQNDLSCFTHRKDAALNWSPRKSPCGFMTKVEEEVAEILFSMVSMFPDKEASLDARCPHYSARNNKSILSEAMECSIPVLEGNRMESDLGAHSMTNEVVSTSVNEGKHGEETKEVTTSYEYVIPRTCLPDKHICEESYQGTEPLPRVLSSRETSYSKILISCSAGFNLESRAGFGSQQPKKRMQALNQETPESTDGLASCRGSELQSPGIFKGMASNDSLTWLLGVSMGSNESSNPQLMRASTKPAWIDATVHYRKPISRVVSHSNASKYTVDRIPWKRCATHVWIGYLIQKLKGGNMESASMPQMHMEQEINTDRELRMQASLRQLRTCSSSAVSLSKLIEVKHEPTRNEVKSGIPFLETLKEKPLQTLHSVVYKPEKQVFDFLSLSNGDSGVNANTSKDRNRGGNRSLMGSCLSLGPSNTPGAIHAIPTQNNYYPPSYGNQSSSAGLQQVGQQLPTHVGSCSSNFPQKGPCILTQEQHQQQMLWATMAYPQGLQATNFDHPTRIQCSAPMVPFSPNIHFPKYTMMVPQHHHHHQQLASLPRPPALFSGSKTPQDHCLPAGVQFYAGALLLQLLCNERL